MAPPHPAPTAASRAFDLAVLVAGLGAMAVTAISQQGNDSISRWYLLAIPLIVLIAQFPLLLDRRGGAIEIGFDSCVLIFLVCTISPGMTMVLWAVGVVITQATNNKRLSLQVFNIGLSLLSGAVTIFVIASLSDQRTGVSELLAVGLGCTAYFATDFVISAISAGLDQQTPIWPGLAHPDAFEAGACFVATASLGYLAALVVRHLPRHEWSVLLLAVPLTILLVAARAVTRGRENSRRLGVLFDAASGAQKLDSAAEVLTELEDDARELLRVDEVEVRPAAPGPYEIGAKFSDGPLEHWIIAKAGHRARSTEKADQQGLEALAAVAVEALSRLRFKEAMSHLAHHDVLTELPNRALFLDRAEHALLMSRRRENRLAVLYCDLDGFKRVNDRFGHAAGDDLLVEVAARIRACLRDSDTVARLGGDEFAILLEEVDDDGQVDAACTRVLEALRERIRVAEHFVSVSTSIGVAYSETAQSADGLLRNADMAMYQAKSQGKDRYAVYKPALGRARVQRLEMVEALRNAVDQRQLSVVYQPVVELRTGEIVGIEALARWARDGAQIPPDLFIEAAEESGLVVPLGEVVLNLVVADAPKLRAAAGGRFTLGVNISAQQMRHATFIDQLLETRSRLGDVELLLEVTERDFVPNDSLTLDAMAALAADGVRFAVDDFGIGFSSIGYLGQLPVHVLKTDRSFSATIDEHERACKLLRSMVVMGEALGLQIIVEGVERTAQLDHLIRHVGAPMAQGYLLHRPMTAEQLVEVLANRRHSLVESAALSASRLI